MDSASAPIFACSPRLIRGPLQLRLEGFRCDTRGVTRAALASTTLLAGLAWSGALIADPAGWDDQSVLLIGAGVLTTQAAATVGLLLSGGRWARRAAFATLAGCLVIALVRPIDNWWIVAIALTCLAFASLLTTPIVGLTRKLPSASGPPERAVLLTMTLVAAPLLIGLASWEGANAATLTVGISAPLSGLWYSRVMPGGLFIARYAWPSMAVGLSFLQPWPGGASCAVLGALVFLLGLDRSVKVAFHPPTETGSTYAIPPELTPPEVRGAAGIDERGRRR